MKKIRVLHFSIGNVKGGVTQYVLNLWDIIEKERFQFDFVSMSHRLDFDQELKDAGCKVFYISCYAEDNREQFIKEMDEILNLDYDIVHIHTNWWRSFLVEELAVKHNVKKIIIHSHNTGVGILDDEKRNYELKRHMIGRDKISTDVATDFWACSRAAADWLFGEKVPKEKIVIMHNAINVDKFKFNDKVREKMRKELGLENKFILGYVGRLSYQKNHEFLIRVFAEVCQEREDVVLLLIGVGELEKSIRETVELLGLTDKVIFLGKRNDVPDLLQIMDLFCMPSRFEGLPIVLIEAQTAGLRCICSDCITDEVIITENIRLLALETEIWKNEIIKWISPYERKDMTEEVTKAGYNISFQIKQIENGYCVD